MAFTEEFGISQDEAMDYLDEMVQKETEQIEGAYCMKRRDFDYDHAMAETGPLSQSIVESEYIIGGEESDEDQDLRVLPILLRVLRKWSILSRISAPLRAKNVSMTLRMLRLQQRHLFLCWLLVC